MKKAALPLIAIILLVIIIIGVLLYVGGGFDFLSAEGYYACEENSADNGEAHIDIKLCNSIFADSEGYYAQWDCKWESDRLYVDIPLQYKDNLAGACDENGCVGRLTGNPKQYTTELGADIIACCWGSYRASSGDKVWASVCIPRVDVPYKTCDDNLLEPYCTSLNWYYPSCKKNMCWECGDGIKHQFEECDDGNLIDGDGCSSTCRISEVVPTPSPSPTITPTPSPSPEPTVSPSPTPTPPPDNGFQDFIKKESTPKELTKSGTGLVVGAAVGYFMFPPLGAIPGGIIGLIGGVLV